MFRKALVIDDAESIHALVRAHLNLPEIQVLSAYDGESGVETAIESRPQIVLLDVELPDIDGYEVCRRLKANPLTRSIPVLFLTAAASGDDKARGLGLGAYDYIVKPFSPAELQARINAALRTKALLDDATQNAMVDALTGLFSRGYFESRLNAELARGRRSGHALGCICVDIDDMASINKIVGAAGGDEIIHHVGRCILQACRREDVVCRFGNDEFVILVSEAEMPALEELGRRICQAVRAAKAPAGNPPPKVAVSVGIAASRFSTGMSIVVQAQEALDNAKKAGGDQVVVGQELLDLRLAV